MTGETRRRAYGRGRKAERLASWWLRLKGYRLSKKNRSVDLFQTRLEGKIHEDVLDLFVLCEPGEIRFVNPSAGDWARFEKQRRQRIQGVPAP